MKRDRKYYAREDFDGYTQMRAKAGSVQSRKLDQQALATVADAVGNDGRVDLEEAKTILRLFSDGRGNTSEFTCNERWTLRYVVAEFEWDQDAHDFIIAETKKIPSVLDIDDRKITNESELLAVFWGPPDENLGIGGEPHFHVGSTVSIVGLHKCTEFNGRQAKVVSYDTDADRYEVEFGDGVKNRVKTVNISSRTTESGEPLAKKTKGDDGLIFVDGMMLDKAVIAACRRALKQGPVTKSGSRIIDALEAVEIFKEMADDEGVTRTERWTMRFCLASYPFTRAAHYFLVEALGRDKLAHNDKKGA